MLARNDTGSFSVAGHPFAEPLVQDMQDLIAIVDDDESVREATKGLMRSMGLAAEAFASGEEFLSSVHLSRTACLVTDLNMPGMSGLDLHRLITAQGASIPTVMITGYPNDSTRARALNAGVIGYLVKPFNEDELIQYVRLALSQAEDGHSSS